MDINLSIPDDLGPTEGRPALLDQVSAALEEMTEWSRLTHTALR